MTNTKFSYYYLKIFSYITTDSCLNHCYIKMCLCIYDSIVLVVCIYIDDALLPIKKHSINHIFNFLFKKGLDRMYKLLLHLVDMKMYSSQAVTIYLLHPTPNMQLFVYIFIKNVHCSVPSSVIYFSCYLQTQIIMK